MGPNPRLLRDFRHRIAANSAITPPMATSNHSHGVIVIARAVRSSFNQPISRTRSHR
jgi:hypothetical protein